MQIIYAKFIVLHLCWLSSSLNVSVSSYHINLLTIVIILKDISTSYVDYLHAKPSAPPTPIGSVHPSRPASLKPLSRQISSDSLSTDAEPALPTLNTGSLRLTETTPLLPSTQSMASTSLPRRELSASNVCLTDSSFTSRDNSPHLFHHHHVHHIFTPIIPSAAVSGVPIDILTNSPRILRQLGLGHSHAHGHVGPEQGNEGEGTNHIHHHHDHEHEHHLRVGRRRQVIGILVSVLR